MLDGTFAKLCAGLLARTVRAMPARVTANQVTVAGFAVGIAAAALVAVDLAPIGLAFLVLSRIADGLDGALARLRGPTALGAFLDAALDLIVYAALPVAFALRDPSNALAAGFLLFCFAGMMMLELSFRFALRNGATLPPPLLGHTETFVAFAIACAYPPAFALVAYIYGAACFVAMGVRVAEAVTHLGNAKP